MLGKLLLSKQRKIYPRLNFYSHNLMMTDHCHKLQTIVWGSWGVTELIVYYWPELTYLSSSSISLFFSFFFSPQTAGRANRYTHSEILITLGRTRQLMPPFKSGERTRHFKGMIHLILKWISKSDQMTYTILSLHGLYVEPWRSAVNSLKDGWGGSVSQRQACWQLVEVVFSNTVMAVPLSLPEKAVGCMEY